MKKNYILVLFLFTMGSLLAQNKKTDKGTVVIKCSEFHETRPLRDIVAENPVDENKVYDKEESEDRENRKPQKFRFSAKDGPQYGNDPNTIQDKMGHIQNRAPITSWAGQNATGFRPFDPSGAAGPNNYVQMINSTTFKVYNKVNGTVSFTATLGNLWSTPTPNDGDPIVLYDKAADRWFLAQFGQTGNSMYIAISKTNDPGGAYYTYTFTSPAFPDYLKFSAWVDGYYMTSNQAQKVFCFERTAMLAGNAGARALYTSFSPPQGSGFFVPLSGDASDGTMPAAGTPCPIFSYSDNGWGAGYSDAVNIYQMSVNWVPTTPTATITLAGNVPTAAFDGTYDASWNDVSQPNTAQKLDGIGGVCMFRSQWKTFSGYNSALLNWGVKISSTQRSIKWCELRQNQSTGVWSMYQEGIYTPDASTRWMGSIAMDNNGSIGLAYMKSDATSIFPGLYYTGRRSCDPLGTLPITETQVIAGTGSQTGGNRDGDYADLVLDPDGVTFWYTGEYMGGSTGSLAAKTQIFSFQIPSCGNTAMINISQTTGTNPECPGATATFTATPTNGGTTPIYQWQVNGSNVGTNSSTYTSSTLTNGQIVTCIMTSNLPGVIGSPATSNSITMTVNPLVTPSVSIAITFGNNPTCPGSTVTFSATPTNGGSSPTYQWKVNGANVGTNSPTYTTTSLTNGQIVTCEMTSNELCTTAAKATSNSITMSVAAASTPTVTISQTSGTNPQCAGASSTFTATVTNGSNPTYQWKVNGTVVGTNSSTYTTSSLTNGQTVSCDVSVSSNCTSTNIGTLGTATTTNITTNDVGVAYPTYYGNGRQQYLIKASELTALGLSAGNITSLGFSVAGTTGNPATLNGYTIKMSATASAVMTTTFLTPVFTTVYGPVNYTPTLNAINTHTFTTPFVWDGISNIVIDICFSNQVTGTVAYLNYQTTSSFVSTAYYQADGPAGAAACTQTTGSGTGSIRPNMVITTLSNAATASSNVITMSVNTTVTPSVSIALTSGANPECSGASATFTATPVNGGTTPSFQWMVNGVNAGTNSPTFTTASLTNGQIITCVMTSSSSCASPTTATSNGITMVVDQNSPAAVSIALTSGTNPACAGTSLTFTATPTNGGGAPSYQWQVNGVNAGTNNASYSTSTLTNGQVVSCTMISNSSCASVLTAVSNNITMVVNASVTPSVSIALTTGSNPECPGSTATFTATPVNGGSTPSYQWQVNGVNVGTNSVTYSTSTLTNGQIISCILTSNALCASPTTATSNSITMTVNSNVNATVAITQTGGANPQCSGEPATFTATVTNGNSPSYQWKVNGVNVGTNSPTYTTSTLTDGQIISCAVTATSVCPSLVTQTLGTGTSTNSASSINGAVYPTLNGNGRQQYIIRASELTALGFSAGNITSLGFNNSSAVGNPATLNGYTVKMSSTASTVSTTSFLNPAFTTVFGPVNYTPTLSAINTHTFSTPFVWDGVSNIIVDICFSNQVTGTTSYRNTYTTVSFNSSVYFGVNGVSGAGVCTQTTGTTGTRRPNMVITMGTNTTNATSNSITMNINTAVIPSVSIALTGGTNPECSGSSATFTATPTNGGASPSYQWQINGVNTGTNSSTLNTSSLTDGQVVTCIMTSSIVCASPTTATSNGITMNVNPNLTPSVAIALTTGTNPSCSGSLTTFTATPTNGGATPSYQWQINGLNAGGNSPTLSTTSLTNGQVVTCIMTSSASCVSPLNATSNWITMIVNVPVTPSVSIALTSGTNPECSGSLVTFSATPVNGGATPSFQWQINGVNAGTNSSTFSTTTLTNGQVVTCVMTSSAACANPAIATSNGITMTVNTSVTASVSIAITTGTNPECTGSLVSFSATPVNGGTTPSYQWKINGSNVGSNNPSFTTSSFSNGQVVTCVMTSNAVCVSPLNSISNGVTMTVNPVVTPSVSIALTNGSNPTCAGSTNSFTATPVNGGSSPSFQWRVNNVGVGTNSPVFTSSSLTNGQVVTCVMTSNANCLNTTSANSNAITMVVEQLSVTAVSISLTSGSNPECNGSSATFTAIPVNGGLTPSFQWSVDGVNEGSNSNTFITSALANAQVVSCVMTSNASCINSTNATSNNITMFVDEVVTPSVSIALTSGVNPQCSGTPVTFTATATNGGSSPSYQWKVGSANVGLNSNNFTSSNLSDGDVVTCVMTSNSSCTTINPVTSNPIVMSVLQSLTASVSITVSPGSTICSGTQVTFTAVPSNGGSTPVYQWKNGSTNVGTNSDTFSSSSISNGDIITCEMISNSACITGNPATSNSIAMRVNSNVTSGVTISSNAGNSICPGTNVTFTATPVNGGSSPAYQWKNGSTNVGSNGPVFSTNSLSDGDIITCEMTSNAVCVSGSPSISNAITISVTVNGNPVISTFTPSSGGIGEQIVIAGSGFSSATSVTFNGAPSSFLIINDNQITATVPVGTSTGPIIVTNLCGNTSSISDFTIVNSVTLNVKVFIEGYYSGGGLMDNGGLGGCLFVTGLSTVPSESDSITISLQDATNYSLIDSKTGILHTDGNVTVTFDPNVHSGTTYYIRLKHRNALETWSAAPVMMGANTSYDFTSSQTQAYGNNMVKVFDAFQYAIFSGDISDQLLGVGNQDLVIESQDYSDLENALNLIMTGYVYQDITGDGIVESADYTIMENNVSNIIVSMHP